MNEWGLINGHSNGRFGSNDTLFCAQLAQILFNKEGRPGANSLIGFSDVAGEAWYIEAVYWATSQEIVSGYGDRQLASPKAGHPQVAQMLKNIIENQEDNT